MNDNKLVTAFAPASIGNVGVGFEARETKCLRAYRMGRGSG